MKKEGEKGNQPLPFVPPLSSGSFSPIKSGLFKRSSVSQRGGECLPKRRAARCRRAPVPAAQAGSRQGT